MRVHAYNVDVRMFISSTEINNNMEGYGVIYNVKEVKGDIMDYDFIYIKLAIMYYISNIHL